MLGLIKVWGLSLPCKHSSGGERARQWNLCKWLSMKLLMAFSLFENSIDEPPVIAGRHGTATEKGETGSLLGSASRVARCVGARVAFPGKLQPREWSYGESSCSRLAGW